CSGRLLGALCSGRQVPSGSSDTPRAPAAVPWVDQGTRIPSKTAPREAPLDESCLLLAPPRSGARVPEPTLAPVHLVAPGGRPGRPAGPRWLLEQGRRSSAHPRPRQGGGP